MPDIDRVEYGLVNVAVREWLGYVWVCLADEPPSFEDDVIGAVVERLGDVESIEHYGVDSLEVGRRIVYDVKANWKLIIENFMECYHCATIHPELTEVLPEFADGYAAQYFVGHGAEFGADVEGFTVDGSRGPGPHPGRRPRTRTAATTRSPIRPQVFINLVPDHVIFHRMFPLAADRTDRRVRLAVPARTSWRAARTSARSVELFHRVNLQDFDACERCQPAMSSRATPRAGSWCPASTTSATSTTGCTPSVGPRRA